MGCAIRGILERQKPYIAIIFAQAAYASLTLLSKAVITKGMNPYVFGVYRQAFATLALTPFAFFLESHGAAPLSGNILLKTFFASFGITADLNLFCVAMRYTTATLAAASSTTTPTLIFVMAVLLGIERISIKKWHGIAKVLGSLVSLSGALVYTFVQGPPINLNWWSSSKGKEIPSPFVQYGSKSEWLKGSLLMLSANTTSSLWLIMQAPLVKQYPSKLRLVTLQCFFSCIQSTILAMATQRSLSSWKLGSSLNLYIMAHCGVMGTAFGFWLRVWAIEKKGPVFAGMFSPLSLILTVIFSAIVWKEIYHLGSVCGAILLVGGLYSVLWGKNRDIQEKKLTNEQKSETKEETTLECIT